MTIRLVLAQVQAQAPVPVHHFFNDWAFWQGAIALLALVLSQFPPLIGYFRPGRLKADFASKVFITHTFGNANINFLIALRNVGARELRVRSMSMMVKRSGDNAFRLDAHQFENPGDPKAYFLVPFTIGPRVSWVRQYIFFKDADPQTDKEVRANRYAVSRQIRERRADKNLPPNSAELVDVDEVLIAPFKDLFHRQFRWFAGEYEVELTIETDPAAATLHKKLRFVLFEGDTDQLKDHVLEYSTGGGGIIWPGERALGVFPVITEVA